MRENYLEVREIEDFKQVNIQLNSSDWYLIEIYKRKRQVPFSNPVEFEEFPVYILALLPPQV